MVQWSVTKELSTVDMVRVFSGGACNIRDAKGQLLRNKERDTINDWLTSLNVTFFDPQIHPDTHGCEYNYAIHSKVERLARKIAQINLYEVSPRTFGGITSMEVAVDHFRWEEPMVIYFSDGDESKDSLPEHSKTGYPLFLPDGLDESEESQLAHYREFLKNGNRMRKYVMQFALELDTLTVSFGDNYHRGDLLIYPDRMQAVDLFEAVVNAASGERVFINFMGDSSTRDEKGSPMFIIPENPPEMERRALLDQYMDEGNRLRHAIAELVHINVYTRVVYTQKAAIQALYELLDIRGILPEGSKAPA
ncbi:MAG: hypothetical protein ACPG7F_05510 [Aggregatilineales bacterium]